MPSASSIASNDFVFLTDSSLNGDRHITWSMNISSAYIHITFDCIDAFDTFGSCTSIGVCGTTLYASSRLHLALE